MRNPLTLWLTGIIVLTIIGFLVVFKPITLSARKDPSDASRYLKPVGVEHFNAQVAPSGTFPLYGKTSVFVYKPQHDLRLGLDLRGGMRVVLSIPDVTTFNYELAKSLEGDEAINSSKQKLTDLLKQSKPIGSADDKQFSVDVDESSVTIVTEPSDTAQATEQLEAINAAMTTVFGADQFTAPKAANLFNPEALKKQREANQESVRSIMETRLNSTGLTEVTAYAEGEKRVVLEIPGVKDPEEVQRILRTTAQLEFYLIPDSVVVTLNEDNNTVTATIDGVKIPGTSKEVTEKVLAQSQRVMTGADMETFEFEYAQNQPAIGFVVKPEKQEDFGIMTAGHIGDVMAIVLDQQFQMVPVIRAAITSNGIIEGNFTEQEAQEWVRLLKAGSLPVPVTVVETRTVSATLGADSISKSVLAGIVGLAAVLIFMAAYYRLPGLMANMALIIYIILSLAVMKVFDATLTLPGIAGVIIAIGMAVDANVIIFERLKEELRTQKPLETAIDVAFSRAWTAILDSNVASLITGAVLYALGTGAVKGFAITLLIGVAVSLFTSVTVTRLFMRLMIRSKAGHNLAWYGI
ncbi:MAG: protein translocase subunit SecD [Armatimonadota bacterium]